jgi:hypothetical protein
MFDRFRLRKNEADKRSLVERIKRLAINLQLESTRDSAFKLSQRRQLLPNSNFALNEDVSNCQKRALKTHGKSGPAPDFCAKHFSKRPLAKSCYVFQVLGIQNGSYLHGD